MRANRPRGPAGEPAPLSFAIAMRRGLRNKYYEPERLARIGSLQLIARSVVEGYLSGLHKSPFKGFSAEFSEYREYLPGDDLKHFDWKVYARSDKKYVREYEEETNMTCTVLLDCSASMGYGSKGVTKLDYGCFLTAALTYLMVRQRDKVGLVAFDEKIRQRIPPRSSPAHMKYILDQLERLEPGGQTRIADSLHAIAEGINRRGLVVVISDLIDDRNAVMKVFQHFRHDRHELIVFNVFDRAESEFRFEGLIEFQDLETDERMQVRPEVIRSEYRQKFEDFVAAYRADCNAARIDYELVNTDTPFEFMLSAYLARRQAVR